LKNHFRLEWHGETPLTIADLEGSQKGSKLEAAENYLLKALSDGPKEFNWIIEQSKGICSKRTLDEAKKSLGLVTEREGKGKDHKAFWAFPTGRGAEEAS